jgi:indolepyruvate ferredoxin oxidoreductase beta subunit
MPETRPLTIAIAAMGGQGGGVLADWLIEVAEHGDHLVQCTSVPGVAQRTGATVYYLEMFPKSSLKNGRSPVMALMPVPGDVDIVLAGELMEAGRAAMRGFVSPDRTVLIASSHRDYAIGEKSAPGDGRADAATVLEAARGSAKDCIAFDMAALAEETGSVISSVLLGAIAGAGVLPFARERFEDAIRHSGVAVDRNLAGFSAGFERAARHEVQTQGEHAPGAAPATPQSTHPSIAGLLERIENEFDAPIRETLTHGVRRLVDYQDPAYAGLYLDRLLAVHDLDRRSGKDHLLTTETARHLALWMSYEDTIRVAELKTRASRFARARAEVRATPDQIVRLVEFMHPRVEEICDTLPAGLGRRILNTPWLRKFVGFFCRRGRQIRTTSVTGFLLLYFVSALKPMRRRTLRFALEDARIRDWLDGIVELAAADYGLAVEFARCQGLIKGYGDTHERGLRNFNAMVEALPAVRRSADSAARLRELRDAALADEDGAALRKAIQQ